MRAQESDRGVQRWQYAGWIRKQFAPNFAVNAAGLNILSTTSTMEPGAEYSSVEKCHTSHARPGRSEGQKECCHTNSKERCDKNAEFTTVESHGRDGEPRRQ